MDELTIRTGRDPGNWAGSYAGLAGAGDATGGVGILMIQTLQSSLCNS